MIDEIKTIEKLAHDGDYTEALKKLEQDQQDENLSNAEKICFLSLKCDMYNRIGKYTQTIGLSKELRENSIKENSKLTEIDSYLYDIFANYRLNNVETGLNLVKKAEQLMKKYKMDGMEERRAQLLVNKVYLYTAKGETNQAFLHAQENFYLCKEITDKSHLARSYHALGWVHTHMGDIDKAIEHYQQSLEMRENIGDVWSLAHTSFSLGYLWRQKGHWDMSLNFFNRSLKIREKIGNQQDIAWTILNLGDIHYAKGEVNNAQTYYENSLMINRKLGFKFGIIYSLTRLASVFESVNDAKLVIDTLEKALDYSKDVVEVESEVHVLSDLIIFISKNKIKTPSVKTYLDRLRFIKNQYKSKIYDQAYRLSEALMLANSKSTKNKKKAMIILQEISEEEIVMYDFTKIAMTNYSEMLAVELKKYLGEDSLVSELHELSDSLSFNEFQQAYSMVAENFLNQSKSALDDTDLASAQSMLRKAQYLCDFLNLYNKGPTPFRIMFLLFMKESSLNEISKVLSVTKGALTGHIKLLNNLDLVKISREEQIRSATMLKKYYTLSERGIDLIQPLKLNICETINEKEDKSKSFEDFFITPRLITKMVRDTTYLIDEYQNFIEQQVISTPLKDAKKKTGERKSIEAARNIFEENDEVTISQFFLSDDQYKIYSKLRKEFNDKVKKEVFDNKSSQNNPIIEKPNYVAHITMPIKELLRLERHMKKKSKDKKKE